MIVSASICQSPLRPGRMIDGRRPKVVACVPRPLRRRAQIGERGAPITWDEMCGRFVSSHTAEEIATYFGASFEAEPLPLSYNVAPTDEVYAVVADGDGHDGTPQSAVRAFHWGLVPVWAKDVKIGSSLINARAETIGEKAAFKKVFLKYRCIIPMAGFYEWQAATSDGPVGTNGKPVKQPVFVHRRDGEPMAVAGVWSVWRDRAGPKDAPWLHSCAVITTSANETLSSIHDRMPVVLPRRAWQQWLDPNTDDPELLQSLLRPAPESLLTLHKVSTQVNSVRNQGEALDRARDRSRRRVHDGCRARHPAAGDAVLTRLPSGARGLVVNRPASVDPW